MSLLQFNKLTRYEFGNLKSFISQIVKTRTIQHGIF